MLYMNQEDDLVRFRNLCQFFADTSFQLRQTRLPAVPPAEIPRFGKFLTLQGKLLSPALQEQYFSLETAIPDESGIEEKNILVGGLPREAFQTYQGESVEHVPLLVLFVALKLANELRVDGSGEKFPRLLRVFMASAYAELHVNEYLLGLYFREREAFSWSQLTQLESCVGGWGDSGVVCARARHDARREEHSRGPRHAARVRGAVPARAGRRNALLAGGAGGVSPATGAVSAARDARRRDRAVDRNGPPARRRGAAVSGAVRPAARAARRASAAPAPRAHGETC